MNLGLFACHDVGLEIATFLAGRGEEIACLALDSKDTGGQNAAILAVAGTKRVVYSDQLGEEETLRQIRALDLDLIVLAWWPYIIKPAVIGLAKRGCLNFHNSLLPFNRGKNPNFWSIVEGTPYGVTLHFVDPGVDTGEVAFQLELETTWEDTGKTLHERGKAALVQLFKDVYDDLKAGRYVHRRQDPDAGTFHRARELEGASRIDLDKTYTARDLLNLLRARTYPPHPASWFIDGGEKYEVRVEIRKVPG